MRIRKVKITKYDQIAIVYEDGFMNRDEYSITCRDKARPEFYEALEALQYECEAYIKGDRAQGSLFGEVNDGEQVPVQQ